MFKNFSLRSKLILILLAVSLLASGIVIGIGYWTGVDSISDEVYQRLTSARNAKAFEIEQYFANQSHITEVLAANQSTATALLEFSRAFRQIERSDTINCTDDLDAFYQGYVEKMSRVLEVRRDVDAFYPTSAAACYLQYHYVIDQPDAAVRAARSDARDGSAYSNAHRKHHDFFLSTIQKFGYYDAFLIDIQTSDIVYTTMKEADFATNLKDGPYRNSNLAALLDEIRRNADLDEAQVVDFDFYRPSYGAPAAFIGAPVLYQGELIGALVFQLSIDRINHIMNFGGEWADNGLGQTGEVLLVGDDYLLRSDSRMFLEDRERFLENVSQENMGAERRKLLTQLGPILVTELRSDNITEAMRGRRDIMEIDGYHGQPVLSAFTPLDLPGGLRWALVTEIDKNEALKPVTDFQRRNLSALAFIIALITILAMLITRAIVRPIDRLTKGAARVSTGDTSVRVAKTTDDEMGNLTDVFNEMVASIDKQKNAIADQVAENNNLLYSRFPDAIAERYRAGEENIVDHFEGVTVLACDLRGTQFFEGRTDERAWAIVQELSERFLKAAEDHGMEIINVAPDGFLAVCGMNIPRLDNTRRVTSCALRLRDAVQAVNTKFELAVTMNLGMSQGEVLAGIIRGETNDYVVWGDTIDIAQRLAYVDQPSQMLADKSVMDLLVGNFQFSNVRTVLKEGGKTVVAGHLDGRVSELQQQDATPQSRK